ncbi:hypothetical protein BZA77DRAFT_354749 [Pyronema omphalodes]|nr:hypothetical protein BZA77DRAFT_354749 [Pyronema omphalodes]
MPQKAASDHAFTGYPTCGRTTRPSPTTGNHVATIEAAKPGNPPDSANSNNTEVTLESVLQGFLLAVTILENINILLEMALSFFRDRGDDHWLVSILRRLERGAKYTLVVAVIGSEVTGMYLLALVTRWD